MPGRFFDTNVLLYIASTDTAKAMRAEELVGEGGTISVQVLNEIANIARRKMALSWTETRVLLASFRGLLSLEPITLEVHERGIALSERYELAIYDAMIVASALQSECDVLWSEDMQDGLLIEDVLRIINPFRSKP